MNKAQGQYKEPMGISIVQMLLLIVAGMLSGYYPVVISLIWLVVMGAVWWGAFNDRMDWVWYGAVASPVLEVWARMAQAPYVPYEIGKYFLLSIIILLLAHHVLRRTSRPLYKAGNFIVLLIIPSLVVNMDTFSYDQWVFNALGIFELAILMIFASRERWHVERFCRTLHFAVAPVICMLADLMLTSSDFSKMSFDLISNSLASGGFGSNQVSTVLGYCIVLVVILQILNRPVFQIPILNYVLLALLIYRGLLTFSRGGMFVALAAVFVALSANIFSSVRSFIRSLFIMAGLGLVAVFVFFKVNDITNNRLLQRYEGETYSTLHGYKSKSWNVISSGRENIALTDINIFKENVLFGVGPGIAKTMRHRFGFANVAAHTEFTRLLSEHGIGGAGVIVVLLAFPFWWIGKQKELKWKSVAGALFILSIATTFHAAMRTNTSIICYVLAVIPIFYYTNKQKFETPAEDTIYRQ